MLPERPPQRVLLVGVDVHRQSHVARCMDQAGHEIGSARRVRNHRPGLEAFARQLDELAGQGGYEQIQLTCEATNRYWWGLFDTLKQTCQTPVQLYAINPRLTANFKKTLALDDHTDAGDAWVIAERLRLGRDLPAPFAADPQYGPLRLLTRQRFHLGQALGHEKAYATNLIYLKFSQYTVNDQRPFQETFGATSRAVLRRFGSRDDLLALPLAELAAWLNEQGRQRFADPQTVAQRLQAMARDSFGVAGEFQAPLQMCLESSLNLITALEQQRRQVDVAIAVRLQAIPNTLTTIPGVGPVLAAGLLAEIGDIHRFDDDDDKVAKLAGLKWRRHQSGEFEAEDTPITFQCNRYLRYYFCAAANLVRIHEPTYAAYYRKKYAEVPKHQHKRAIVLTARKLVRLVTRLLASHQPYQAAEVSA